MLAATPTPVGTLSYPAESRNGLQSFGALCVVVYVFLVFSRLPELLVQKFGINLYMMAVVMFFSLVVVALNGRMTTFLTNTTLRWYVFFYFCITASYPFSIWRGATLELLLHMYRMGLICVALVGILDTVEDCRKTMMAIPLGMIVILFIGFTAMPTDVDPDLRFRLDYGSLANPNEFANHMMIGLPLCAVVLLKKSRSFVARAFLAGLLGGTLALLVKTGSRGGITIAITLAVVLFLTASLVGKMKLFLAGLVLGVIAIAAVPSGAIDRYATMFSDAGGGEAVQSKAARMELLRASLRITAQHPLLGVGLSNFVTAYNRELAETGKHGHWEVTHNGYTQISSEAGIPAFVAYIAVMFLCARGLLRLRKATKGVPQFVVAHRLASMLLLAFLAYAISNLFTSNAHEFYLPLLVGFSVALTAAAQRELAAFRKARAGDVAIPPRALQPVRSRPIVFAGRRLQPQ